ncbi:hypothetical protein GCM10011611_08190 [Aliidongia dinghuensis]|uniref:Uncharacterized protein n=1 Tax=Aliidongia dinghuensis TaxID=1867774 RepID=A0A8J2YQI1_9PROT|nr:hypothetical protein GCM10011611_08190 [Aliidongia dinghuensis]
MAERRRVEQRMDRRLVIGATVVPPLHPIDLVDRIAVTRQIAHLFPLDHLANLYTAEPAAMRAIPARQAEPLPTPAAVDGFSDLRYTSPEMASNRFRIRFE